MNRPTTVAASPRIGMIHGLEPAAVGRFPVVAAAIGGAWLTLVIAQVTGNAAALHHHALIGGGIPPMLAILGFTLAWQVMVVAMMWPASLHAVAAVRLAASRTPRPRLAIATFLGAFAAVWAGFGLAAFSGDVVVHGVVDATPWLGARPWLIEAGVLAIAGAYQFTPLKRRSMAACRWPGRSMASVDGAAPQAVRLGLRHGVDCVASSWALMLVMFAAGFGSLWSMVALTVLMAYEANGQHGQRAAAMAGIVLLLAALWAVSGFA